MNVDGQQLEYSKGDFRVGVYLGQQKGQEVEDSLQRE